MSSYMSRNMSVKSTGKGKISAKNAAVISASVVAIFVLGTILAFSMLHPVETVTVNMHLKVSNYTGFNLDTDALYFGTISPGGSGTRDLVIQNDAASARTVSVVMSGPLAEWVYTNEINFLLSGYENRSLGFQVNVPEDAEPEEYTGKISLIFTSNV